MNKLIFLPGTNRQLDYFLQNCNIEDKSILVVGAGTEEIAKALSTEAKEVVIIVEDHENLVHLRFLLSKFENISVRMMEFENTDFRDDKFDIIYAQASVSTLNRAKIVKELKRILKKDGIFCVGEVTLLADAPPKFVTDIWENSGIEPLPDSKAASYYSQKKFEVLLKEDLSSTLKDFYSFEEKRLNENRDKLSDQEKSYHKKILKQISHESNAYLNLGGDAYMGFKMLILKKL